MTSYVDTKTPWAKLAAADEISHFIVRRDRREAYTAIAWWLHHPRDYEINFETSRMLGQILRKKMGHKKYYKLFNANERTRFVSIAMWIAADVKRYEWVMTQLTLLGFSETRYPQE